MSKPRKKLGKSNLVGQKVKALREAMGLSQKDFTGLIQERGMDVSEITMSRIEGQLRAVSDAELKVLCEVLDVSADDMLEIKRPRLREK